MTISITGPNGSTFDFPDATPQAEIAAAMDAHFGGAKNVSQETSPASTPSLTEGFVRGAATGVPIIGGLANKAEAATNALLAPLLDKYLPENFEKLPEGSFGERYAHALKIQEAKDKLFSEQHPILDTAANIVGGTAALGGALKAVPALASPLGLTGSLPGMVAKGAASGAALNAADAAIRGNDPNEAAMIGSLTGAVAGPVARGIGAAVNRVMPPANILPTAEQLGEAATAAYQAPQIATVQIKPQAVQGLVANIDQQLLNGKVDKFVAPTVTGIVERLGLPRFGNTHLISDLDLARQSLSDVPHTEARAAGIVRKAIDDYLGNDMSQADLIAGDARAANTKLLEARANYAAMKRAEMLDAKVTAGELQASSTHSGMNLENVLRQRVRSILTNPKLTRGLTTDELNMMEKFVRGSISGNFLRGVSNVMGGGGGLGMLAGGSAGALATGSMAGAPIVPLAGYGLKRMLNANAMNAANELSETLRARAPAAALHNLYNQLSASQSAAQRAQIERIIAAISRSTAVPMSASP